MRLLASWRPLRAALAQTPRTARAATRSQRSRRRAGGPAARARPRVAAEDGGPGQARAGHDRQHAAQVEQRPKKVQEEVLSRGMTPPSVTAVLDGAAHACQRLGQAH